MTLGRFPKSYSQVFLKINVEISLFVCFFLWNLSRSSCFFTDSRYWPHDHISQVSLLPGSELSQLLQVYRRPKESSHLLYSSAWEIAYVCLTYWYICKSKHGLVSTWVSLQVKMVNIPKNPVAQELYTTSTKKEKNKTELNRTDHHWDKAWYQLATIFQMTDGEMSCMPKLCLQQICSLC